MHLPVIICTNINITKSMPIYMSQTRWSSTYHGRNSFTHQRQPSMWRGCSRPSSQALDAVAHVHKPYINIKSMTILIERNPPTLLRGFFVGWFPNQEPGGRGNLLKNKSQNWSILGVVLEVGSSFSGFLVWKPPNKEIPRGGGVLSLNLFETNSMFIYTSSIQC